MKKGAILVNTSRGPLIDEGALLEVLNAGNTKGVGLDVHYSGPLPADSEWRSQEWGKNGTSRVLLTPHTGDVEDDTLTSWYEQTVDNVGKWLNGEEVVRRLA
jgi:phosphoglycerate dehydrogenase-like enzyme